MKQRFIIDKENRRIICVLENTKHDFLIFLAKHSPSLAHISRDQSSKFLLPNRFIGRAVCSIEDEWNEEIGKSLAYKRAYYKFNKSFFKRASTFFNTWDKKLELFLDSINTYGEKISKKIDKREAWMQKILETNK